MFEVRSDGILYYHQYSQLVGGKIWSLLNKHYVTMKLIIYCKQSVKCGLPHPYSYSLQAPRDYQNKVTAFCTEPSKIYQLFGGEEINDHLVAIELIYCKKASK